MTNHFFLRIMIQLKMFGFYFVFLNCLHHRITRNNCNNVVSPVYPVFAILCWYSKNEIPGTAPELCYLKCKQFSPDILKFKTKHEDNLFNLKCSTVPRSFLFIFHAGSRGLSSNNSRNSSYKEKTAGSARVSRLSFRFLWLCLNRLLIKELSALKELVWLIKIKKSLTLILVSCLSVNFVHAYISKNPWARTRFWECQGQKSFGCLEEWYKNEFPGKHP